MQALVTTQVKVHAPAKRVFGYLSDTTYHQLWNPSLRKVTPVGKLRLGQEYETESFLLGVRATGRNKVTKLTPHKEFEVENGTGMLHYRAGYSLRSEGEYTTVICTTTVEAKSKAFAYAKPVLELLARRELQSDLQALKIAVEHDLSA